MLEESFFKVIKAELINGTVKKRHPFRYFSLATLSQGVPRQRTVVLRKMTTDLSLIVYTDTRSQKVMDIKNNPEVSALFYHPKKLMQITIIGEAQFVTDKQVVQQHWSSISNTSRRDYITTLAPGTSIKQPDAVDYNAQDYNFTVLQIVPNRIEYLQLKRPNHLRIAYTKKNTSWKGQFMVP
ncbi:pyridoxamine 5'-phosphate oxidase family protein [Winogradskyella aurantia]|uniref:pyridoxamine 5'-phosphate oxidase family protein n=1 Tax=Winogradskyella aurantia TaxID=1915063 RepID=UPI000BA1A090|nr:pyridoxamine 5'-phosphate oxidase family protein [Winogradskyella aurantia]